VGVARHTRYQAAVVRDGAILLLRCAFSDGRTVWMFPGGGREDGEAETTCVAREVEEETTLSVRVERLLFDIPADPPDGFYERWRMYLCSVLAGSAAPGGGEGPLAKLVDVMWLPLEDDALWPNEIRTDAFLGPQLQMLRMALLRQP
jgi:8-oxo-dGTP pyrophosphatase MutT (NUDIX family)